MKIEIAKDRFKAIEQYKGQSVYFFRYDAEDTETGTVICEEATLMLPNADYAGMVAKCIGVKYNTDAQLALLYNYEADSEAYAEDMAEYQEWRRYCKEACKVFFGLDE